MVTSPHGYVLHPLTEAGCLCTPAAGEHGWEVGPWPMAGWPLCEQSAGLDGPLV